MANTRPQCGGKNSYTKGEAERMKGVIGRKRGKDMRVYDCPQCFWWHLTKKNRAREARPEKDV